MIPYFEKGPLQMKVSLSSKKLFTWLSRLLTQSRPPLHILTARLLSLRTLIWILHTLSIIFKDIVTQIRVFLCDNNFGHCKIFSSHITVPSYVYGHNQKYFHWMVCGGSFRKYFSSCGLRVIKVRRLSEDDHGREQLSRLETYLLGDLGLQ